MPWSKKDVKKELERILDTLSEIQKHYDVYSHESDENISEAVSLLQNASERL